MRDGMPAESAESHRTGPDEHIGPASAIAASIIVLAMLVAALSLWTVIPLTWIWIGSKLSDTQFPSGGPYMLVLIGIVVSILVIAWLIGRLNALYVRVTGNNRLSSARPAWLRSMRDEVRHEGPTVVEGVIVGSVILAVLAMVLWFFLLAGSPLPDQ
jgi:hypothetical protein